MWLPSILLVLLLLLSLMGPGGPEVVVLLALAALQAGFLLINALFWGKNVIESAAGVNE